jgi:hypothetical protein
VRCTLKTCQPLDAELVELVGARGGELRVHAKWSYTPDNPSVPDSSQHFPVPNPLLMAHVLSGGACVRACACACACVCVRACVPSGAASLGEPCGSAAAAYCTHLAERTTCCALQVSGPCCGCCLLTRTCRGGWVSVSAVRQCALTHNHTPLARNNSTCRAFCCCAARVSQLAARLHCTASAIAGGSARAHHRLCHPRPGAAAGAGAGEG